MGGGGGILSLKEPSEVKDVLINSYGKPQGVRVLRIEGSVKGERIWERRC